MGHLSNHRIRCYLKIHCLLCPAVAGAAKGIQGYSSGLAGNRDRSTLSGTVVSIRLSGSASQTYSEFALNHDGRSSSLNIEAIENSLTFL